MGLVNLRKLTDEQLIERAQERRRQIDITVLGAQVQRTPAAQAHWIKVLHVYRLGLRNMEAEIARRGLQPSAIV